MQADLPGIATERVLRLAREGADQTDDLAAMGSDLLTGLPFQSGDSFRGAISVSVFTLYNRFLK
jgi:hypothetical protein